MKHYSSFAALIFVLTTSMAALAQADPAVGSPFAPLEQWKTAILTGDTAVLRMLYSTDPPAEVTVAAGKVSPDADIEFWTALRPRAMSLEISQNTSPQPGVQVILFQAEVKSGAGVKPETVYIKEGQLWRQQGEQWKLAGVQRSDVFHLKQVFSKGKNLYPAGADAHAEIKEAEQKAAHEHKRVLLVFGANWCYDCHVLDLAFHRPDFASVISGYEIVHVDIGEDGKKNADVANQYQVPLDKGVPAIAVLDGDGKLVVSQKNGEFENARALTPEAVKDFLNKWKLETP